MKMPCDICQKIGARGNTIMTRRVEGNVVNICRDCETALDEMPARPKGLVKRLRGMKK